MRLPPGANALSGFFHTVCKLLTDRSQQIECLRLTFLCDETKAKSLLRHAPKDRPPPLLRSSLIKDGPHLTAPTAQQAQLSSSRTDKSFALAVASSSTSSSSSSLSSSLTQSTAAFSEKAYLRAYQHGAQAMQRECQATLDKVAAIESYVA